MTGDMRDDQQASQTSEARVDAGPLAVGRSAIVARGRGGWLFHSEARVCTRELLSLPLEICYSTTFLLQSPSSSLPELGGRHPTECPSLSWQPPSDTMQIYSSFISQIHNSFQRGRGWERG